MSGPSRPDGPDSAPASFRDPRYVATVGARLRRGPTRHARGTTVVGVLATAAVVVYAALVPGPPTPETAVGVLLAVTVPTTVAYELARRVQ